MGSTDSPPKGTVYRPGLAVFAGLASAWVFVLVALGAFTTSIGAGMAFPDWPLSNGSINPNGWLTNINMFAEHSHRLIAMSMGTASIVLAVWLTVVRERRWLVKLSYVLVALVLVQGLVGGLRVLLNPVEVESVSTSLGELFAMLHAVLAQVFACTLIAVACALSKGWIQRSEPVAPRVRTLGKILVCLFFLQLAVAAIVRHSFAGLAIDTFPASNHHGGLLPDEWNFRVAIHFTHRVLAMILGVVVVIFACFLWFDRNASLVLRCGASVLVALTALQILLGANIIWQHRAVALTTSHVVCGALTLVTAFALTWLAHRDQLEASRA